MPCLTFDRHPYFIQLLVRRYNYLTLATHSILTDLSIRFYFLSERWLNNNLQKTHHILFPSGGLWHVFWGLLENDVGRICYIWLTLIPACIHMPSKVWDEISYRFPNPNGCIVEVWEWIGSSIPHLNRCNYLSMLGLKLNHVGKRGPWYGI